MYTKNLLWTLEDHQESLQSLLNWTCPFSCPSGLCVWTDMSFCLNVVSFCRRFIRCLRLFPVFSMLVVRLVFYSLKHFLHVSFPSRCVKVSPLSPSWHFFFFSSYFLPVTPVGLFGSAASETRNLFWRTSPQLITSISRVSWGERWPLLWTGNVRRWR